MTGSDDADLHLRFDQAPTTSNYHCRPYLDGSSGRVLGRRTIDETSVYIMIRAYTAAEYNIEAAWRGPK